LILSTVHIFSNKNVSIGKHFQEQTQLDIFPKKLPVQSHSRMAALKAERALPRLNKFSPPDEG
jgi:hypothetical protein